MRIEFLPWYRPGVPLLLCGGDDGCGLAVIDMEQHRKWHERLERSRTVQKKGVW